MCFFLHLCIHTVGITVIQSLLPSLTPAFNTGIFLFAVAQSKGPPLVAGPGTEPRDYGTLRQTGALSNYPALS